MTAVDPAVPVSEPTGRGLSTRERHALAACWNDDEGKHKPAGWIEVVTLVDDLLAARDAATADRARREGAVGAGERIAQAIEAAAPAAPHTITPSTAGKQATRSAYLNAARIARADRLETP